MSDNNFNPDMWEDSSGEIVRRVMNWFVVFELVLTIVGVSLVIWLS
jgi:hypothetical protein